MLKSDGHALFGEVRDAAGGPINGAVLEILSGLNAGRATMSGSGGLMDGACRLTDLYPWDDRLPDLEGRFLDGDVQQRHHLQRRPH